MAHTSNEPDMVLIAELLEEISRCPPAVYAQKLLVEHYIFVGWLDAARDNVKTLKAHAPHDAEVEEWEKMLLKKVPQQTPKETPPVSPTPSAESATEATDATHGKRALFGKKKLALDEARNQFSEGTKASQRRSKSLLSDLFQRQHLQNKHGDSVSNNLPKSEALAGEEPDNSSGGTAGASGSARSVAHLVVQDTPHALEILLKDLEDLMARLRQTDGQKPTPDNDTIRESLVKRVRALESALPEPLKPYPEVALMHIDHEALGKSYVNNETMLGDAVAQIPRANFYVTEDNYAWDMEELAQAITAQDGVMRNPLSRHLFTPKDIRAIVAHPAGKALAALQLEQHQLSKGVRNETIVQMDRLARILLEDQSADTLPSRHAVDEFLAYCATLPAREQKTIDGLRCPARDTHTGQAYDFTIGQAVRDAKGNIVCFHKTGDFIRQAAEYLRRNKGGKVDRPERREQHVGAATDKPVEAAKAVQRDKASQGKCIVM